MRIGERDNRPSLRGKYAAAEAYCQSSFDNLFQQFQHNFTDVTERERLGLLDTVSGEFPAHSSFVHRFNDNDPQLAGSMYNLLLWEKGLVVGSVTERV